MEEETKAKQAQEEKTIDIASSSKDEVLYIASQNLINFGQLFLPDDFNKSKPAPFHYEVGDALLNDKIRKLCVVLPRGHTSKIY